MTDFSPEKAHPRVNIYLFPQFEGAFIRKEHFLQYWTEIILLDVTFAV